MCQHRPATNRAHTLAHGSSRHPCHRDANTNGNGHFDHAQYRRSHPHFYSHTPTHNDTNRYRNGNAN